MFGLHMGRMGGVGGVSLAAQIAALFASGEQGVWYDPSDFSTLYQDSAGTTPVTAVGQPVGLMLDKRLGLVRGVERIVNGNFSAGATGWTLANAVVTDNALVVTAGTRFAAQSLAVEAGKLYEITFTHNTTTGTNLRLNTQETNGAESLIVWGTPNATSGLLRGIFRATSTSVSLEADAQPYSGTIDNISVRELPGNHATQPTAINRPVLQQDAFGKYYLAFNGTNSWMSTASINFTATDKMTVVAGVRKLSDVGGQLLVELSANVNSNNGTFAAYAGNNAAASGAFWTTYTKGVSAAALLELATTPAPTSTVLTLAGAIGSTPRLVTRTNGVILGTTVGVADTGNFGNYPIYIGARAGASLFFNGNLYSLVIRGALSDAGQITSAEAYANSKTGAY